MACAESSVSGISECPPCDDNEFQSTGTRESNFSLRIY